MNLMNNNKALVFDMDGTLNDFYSVPNWERQLKNESVKPYLDAKPKYNMEYLNTLLQALKAVGYDIIITTWVARGASKEYSKAIRQAKIEWLKKHNFKYDKIHVVKYGTTKANCTRGQYEKQILFDDNKQVRKGWKIGAAVDANQNIIPSLIALLCGEEL